MRTLLRLMPLGLVAAVLSVPAAVPTASAVTVPVAIFDNGFNPSPKTVNQGDTVKWTNTGAMTHTATSDQGFWNSGNIGRDGVYFQTTAFKNAGTYAYNCVHHFGMTGVVRVPLKAPSSAANGFTLRWSSASSTPSNRSFDVQKNSPGSATGWTALKTNTATRSVSLNPTRNGTWRYRARTDNRANGLSSGWSPTKSVTVS